MIVAQVRKWAHLGARAGVLVASLSLWMCLQTRAQAAAAPQDERELSAIAEEQEILRRQLGRLRLTMENLIPRLEKEGRSRALELVREGLSLIQQRGQETRSMTLDELMDSSRTRIAQGQTVLSIEEQELVILQLERLLSILLDRESLERLSNEAESLRELGEQLRQLTDTETQLREQTEDLRQASLSPAERALAQELQRLAKAQKELLQRQETAARENGALGLEDLARQLDELRRSQTTDVAVLEAWQPKARQPLEEARKALLEARAARARAARAQDLAHALENLARRSKSASSADEHKRAAMELEALTDAQARHARTSGNEQLEKELQSLREQAGNLREGASEPGRKQQAAESIEAAAMEQAARAAREREAADAPLAQAKASLDQVEELGKGSKAAAERAKELLEKASAPAANGPQDSAASDEALAQAAAEVERASEEARRMGEALAGAQEQSAKDAQRLGQALENLPESARASSKPAGQALERAAERMRQAAQAASESQAEQSAEQARLASQELEAAAKELSEAAKASGQSKAGQAIAKEQAQLAAELAAAKSAAEQKSAQGASATSLPQGAKQAMEQAQSAMQSAQESMQAGASSQAASSQRQSQEALQRAAEALEEGARPATEEQKAKAAELAAAQEKVAKRLLELATREKKRDKPGQEQRLKNAQSSASKASEELEQGELDQAEQAQDDVIEELQQAMQELQEEEERYQRLRQEELLLKISEELEALALAHRSVLGATREIDMARAGSDRPSRAERSRLKSLAAEEQALSSRCNKLAVDLEAEGSLAFCASLREIDRDLQRVAHDLDELGGWQTGAHVQALQEDVAEALDWLAEALREEQQRRRKDQSQGQPGQNREEKPRLVPDVAELRLMRRMELDVEERIALLQRLHPELTQEGAQIDPLLLEDILRIAERHERATQLFVQMRQNLGLPPPGGVPGQDESQGESDAPQSGPSGPERKP